MRHITPPTAKTSLRVNPLQSLPKVGQPPLGQGAVIDLEATADELAGVPKERIVGACR